MKKAHPELVGCQPGPKGLLNEGHVATFGVIKAD